MKFRTVAASALIVGALTVFPFLGCTSAEQPVDQDDGTFSYGKGIDDNGYWQGITAKDHVEMFDYNNLEIPKESHEVTDEALQAKVDSTLETYATSNQITDRAVADGDTVNIDYVGYVDGVEFEGGNTGGAGTEVTIGTTQYIDDFLEQLIGHMPGETFDVNVTFPDEYPNNPDLASKDAVFNVTINHIAEATEVELTDDFVKENLSATNGWNTVDEMKDGLKADIEKESVLTYVQNYLMNDVKVDSIPDSLKTYQEKSMINYYEKYAEMYGVSLDEFLTTNIGVANTDELLQNAQEDVEKNAGFSLVIQAIAEDMNINISDEDITNYFKDNMGNEDYTSYEEEYGKPYLKQVVMSQKVIDHIVENAKLA